MPSLGFLKKKRTRESPGQNQTDLASPTSTTSSQPTSPVTPTSPRGFDNSIASISSQSTAPPPQSYPTSQAAAPIPIPIPTPIKKGNSATVDERQPMTQGVTPQQQASSHGAFSQNPVPSPEQQTLPTINNLVNPPQHGDSGALAPSNMASHIPSVLSPASSTPHQAKEVPQAQQPSHAQQPTQIRQTKGKYSLGDFNILRTLGTGSFGRVHLVQSKHNQRFYAVKVLKKAQVVKMKQVEHTNDERRMLQEVKHPFLITLWGTFKDAKNLYMVMDFVEGGELFSLLRKSQRFPNPVAKFYAAEVTLAIEYLHSKHIIYRDLKPENLLLDRHGHLKITDFGFAKKVPDITWTLCGTPDYLAPEVVSSKGYNKSVDWWSLGILIFEMLCGFTPFWDGGSPMKIYENILKGRVKYPPYIHPDAADLLQRLITADLTKRLGNLHGGSEDVKNHPWFVEVTWERLAKKDIDAPYVPPVKAGVGDASQFDKYPEETEQYGQGGDDEYGQLFLDF
ncbi:putative cAMP-dependent protein kinase [Venustampulla echinocandica]|uniref:cAMP-dependent protein kinase n=1 Tax=Venustampulla echinocandica TaxID=2656787 RepID=A0A370TRK4_9HELO|nr:putative cAMP-dependent protein kinase [Venustampulla echinocandica]RDL38133.1 putative cAMP-dependent protein kinase [Venustampulla echinocandica]